MKEQNIDPLKKKKTVFNNFSKALVKAHLLHDEEVELEPVEEADEE